MILIITSGFLLQGGGKRGGGSGCKGILGGDASLL